MTKTFDQFVADWTNKHVDVDGVYPDQCMDLMHQFCIDCLGLDRYKLAQPNAYQVFTNFENVAGHELFEKIENTPTFVPNKGDILFFGQAVGVSGHVCIFVSGDVNKFKSFDANWPVGSLPHVQDHNYNGVLGVLRFKTSLPTTPGPGLITTNTPKIDLEEFGPYERQAILSTFRDNNKQIAVLQKDNQTYQTRIDDLTKQLEACQKTHQVIVEQTAPEDPPVGSGKPTVDVSSVSPLAKLWTVIRSVFKFGKDAGKTQK